MDYNEVLQRARVRMAPRCKVCPECNGLGGGNTMPGPGSKAPGNGANDNWRAWRRWCLNMDTIAPNTPVDTSLELLGRTFSLPVIAAPIGSLRAQFNPEDDIRDYNACCIAAAAQTGIAASFGDGLDARVFPHGCALSQQYGGIGLPVINPLSMDTIRANLDLANAARPFAVSVVIDSAGLPHLKAASPAAGSKTVAALRPRSMPESGRMSAATAVKRSAAIRKTVQNTREINFMLSFLFKAEPPCHYNSNKIYEGKRQLMF